MPHLSADLPEMSASVAAGPQDQCLSLQTLADAAGPPWGPAAREHLAEVEQVNERVWGMAEVDIFCDLAEQEMDQLSAAAPMRRIPAGTLIFSPHQPVETLFILKSGRVRIFRVSDDGRALTTALVSPGTIFGEMVILGQQMHDNFAEALDEAVVCVMGKADVRRLLLADPRVSARISETLGRRLADLERRLSDTVFNSVPERVSDTLAVLARTQGLSRQVQVHITHEQLAALVGASRETTTKALGELASAGLIKLGRGKITIVRPLG